MVGKFSGFKQVVLDSLMVVVGIFVSFMYFAG